MSRPSLQLLDEKQSTINVSSGIDGQKVSCKIGNARET